MLRRTIATLGLLLPACLLWAAPLSAASCQNTGSFGPWLDAFRQEAAADGISKSVISSALGGMQLDPGIIARDRKQGVFQLTFLEFAAKLIPKYRLDKGAQLIKQNKALFERIEQEFGVPAPVIVAFWGLETDFGANAGKLPTLRSLATLAYDCRRPELFRDELKAALRIIERGDLSPADMVGSWAGELGQVQFLPRHYLTHAVDYDGDGHANLIKSRPDALASAARFLQFLGWKRGEPWIEEVRVPREMAWEEADLAVRKSRAQWAEMGIKGAGGKGLEADGKEAALLLPMGRNGPAFLAYPNFTEAYLGWNESLIYSLTAAYYATRLAGAAPVGKGNGEVAPFGTAEVRELQKQLVKRGFDVGEVDGKLGARTRAGVKAMQTKLGMPADSYPTPELLARLRNGG
jgi:lytic murein transglycosylase